MTTIIERDGNSDSNAGWAVLVVVLLALIGLGFAYFNGAFDKSTTAIEHNTTINKTIVVPVPDLPKP